MPESGVSGWIVGEQELEGPGKRAPPKLLLVRNPAGKGCLA